MLARSPTAVNRRRPGGRTTHGGRRGTRIDALEWARRGQRPGSGEILLNSMDADGTKAGFDIAMLTAVRYIVDVPVIASGGAGRVEDFAPAVRASADAVLRGIGVPLRRADDRRGEDRPVDAGITVRTTGMEARA